MNCLYYKIENQIVDNHDDFFVKDFVKLIYNNPDVSEKDLQNYLTYFAQNDHLLDNLINTLDNIVKEYNF